MYTDNNIAYSYDPETGEYQCEVECQRHPFNRQDYLIPGHATDVKPPKATTTKYPFWNGKKWELKALPTTDTE